MNPKKRKRSTPSKQGSRQRTKADPDQHTSTPTPISSQYLATTSKVDESETRQSTTSTYPQVPVEVIIQILSEFVTADALNDRESYGKDSRLQKWRRRDICSILLTSRVFYNEASKLMQERSVLRFELWRDDRVTLCKYTYPQRRIGAPGPWNQFRTIKIRLRLTSLYSDVLDKMIDALADTWQLLQEHVHTLDGMDLQQVEIFYFDHAGGPGFLPTAGEPHHRRRLRELLGITGAWGTVFRFDRRLRFLPEADA